LVINLYKIQYPNAYKNEFVNFIINFNTKSRQKMESEGDYPVEKLNCIDVKDDWRFDPEMFSLQEWVKVFCIFRFRILIH